MKYICKSPRKIYTNIRAIKVLHPNKDITCIYIYTRACSERKLILPTLGQKNIEHFKIYWFIINLYLYYIHSLLYSCRKHMPCLIKIICTYDETKINQNCDERLRTAGIRNISVHKSDYFRLCRLNSFEILSHFHLFLESSSELWMG